MVRRKVFYQYERVKGVCPVLGCNFRVRVKKDSYNIKEIIRRTAQHIARKEDEKHKKWKVENGISPDMNDAWRQLTKIQKIIEGNLKRL